MARRPTGTLSSRINREPPDAISILTADHERIALLFEKFAQLQQAKDERRAAQIVEQICNELTIHASIEDEIFYPAVREVIDVGHLMSEAEIEHAVTSDLAAQIEKMSSSDHKFVAAVTVLGDYVTRHVEKERNRIFPEARNAKIDMDALGKEMSARKQELLIELGIEEAET